MTSLTTPSLARFNSRSRWISFGPMPSRGERRPIRTKYKPEYACECSTINRSAGVSTMQSWVGSRFPERHNAQTTSSVNVLHRSQLRIERVALSNARAKRSAPSRSCWSRWSAMRCAAFGPTPGSDRSPATRPSKLDSGSCAARAGVLRSFIDKVRPASATRPRRRSGSEGKLEAGRHRHARGETAHLLLRRELDAAYGVIHRRRHEILEHVLFFAHERRVDRDATHVVPACHRNLDQSRARLTFDFDSRELFLGALQVVLHLLRLLHQPGDLVFHHGVLSMCDRGWTLRARPWFETRLYRRRPTRTAAVGFLRRLS